MTRLQLQHGADMSLCVKLPGHYERLNEFVECTVFGYALRFPGVEFPGANEKTLSLLQERGGIQ
jgi:hypothetical protein